MCTAAASGTRSWLAYHSEFACIKVFTHCDSFTLCHAVAWLLGDRQQQLEAALEAPAVRAVVRQLAHLRWQLQPAAVVCKAGQRENAVWPAAA